MVVSLDDSIDTLEVVAAVVVIVSSLTVLSASLFTPVSPVLSAEVGSRSDVVDGVSRPWISSFNVSA